MTVSRQKKGPEQISRHQERTDITRARLLQAAEKIFARNGFEAAKLEEIASEAGYTRGAFYANFDGKEDLFFALLEQEIGSRIAKVRKHVAKREGASEKLRVLRDLWLEMCIDRRWTLLTLEFKLFAVRHPKVRARLAAMYRNLVNSGVELVKQIVEDSGRKLAVSTQEFATTFFALSSGLTLAHMLDRTVVPEETVRRVMLMFFDAMMGQ